MQLYRCKKFEVSIYRWALYEGCRIDLQLDFVASGLLAGLIHPIAQKAADRMVDAFSQRIDLAGKQNS